MKLHTQILLAAALLWAAPAAAQTYNPPPFPMPPSAEIQLYINKMSAKAAKMPVHFKCMAVVNAPQWAGHHVLEFGVDPAMKSVVLVGWSLLWNPMSHVPKESLTLNAAHDLGHVSGLKIDMSGNKVQISYSHMEFVGVQVPQSPQVQVLKLKVDGKDLQMSCHQ